MKIFISGASGALGSQLVPELVARGHAVVGTTRSVGKTGAPLRMLAGETAVYLMTKACGISSERAKRELGWKLRYPSWRTDFTDGPG